MSNLQIVDTYDTLWVILLMGIHICISHLQAYYSNIQGKVDNNTFWISYLLECVTSDLVFFPKCIVWHLKASQTRTFWNIGDQDTSFLHLCSLWKLPIITFTLLIYRLLVLVGISWGLMLPHLLYRWLYYSTFNFEC